MFFSLCTLQEINKSYKRPKWYALNCMQKKWKHCTQMQLQSKESSFFLQYKLVLCLSSTHWSNPVGCRWHDCGYYYWQNWVQEFCLCVFTGTNFCGLGNNCHSNATCINLTTRFACQCLPGYRGDGVHCEGNSTAILWKLTWH